MKLLSKVDQGAELGCELSNLVPFLSSNLTGHAEKVGIENFELLKVLGTGGCNSLRHH
uniref:Uncharacterized protein n=1 Tax=Zosterops lateralis melanops TaxID=1220523 RepID=A0A8D2PUP0_ZOSLA